MSEIDMDLPSHAVVIPYEKLSSSALLGVIEQYISRDGTDSSHVDLAFDKKVEQVKYNLKTGKALLLFDQKTSTCNIISINDPILKRTVLEKV